MSQNAPAESQVLIWKSCDGGVLFAKQYLLRLGIILYGFRLTFSQIADVGISGIIIDVLTLSSTFLLACFSTFSFALA